MISLRTLIDVEEISHEFKEINWGQVKNPENIYIIIGDSNSEFLGRNYKKNAKNYENVQKELVIQLSKQHMLDN